MIESLKASWDHLPKRPRLPPSLFTLKGRKAWMSIKPTFTYGDERDKIQRENARRAKKQLARDEAWAIHEKKRKERQKERERKMAEREAKREELKKAKAAKVKAAAAKTATTKAMPTAQVPKRSATMPSRTTRSAQPLQARPRVVYTIPAPQPGKPTVQRSRTMPQPSSIPRVQPTRQATAPVTRRVVVQARSPVPTTQRPGAPGMVRSKTLPSPQTAPRRR